MAADISIHQYICEHIEGGALPMGFNLTPFDEPDSPIRMADGAMDGICIYHMADAALPQDIEQRIADALASICAGEAETAGPALESMLREHRAVCLVDQIQRAVMGNTDRINPGALMRYAIQLMFTSHDKEMVKLGLILFELFENPIDELKEIVRELGLCDEFTIFAAWCARNWECGNDEIFAMARKAKGWGRIHCVEMIAPETPEIRDWLLHEGADNAVMPEYSAATCIEKAQVAERLNAPIPPDEFKSVSFLLAAAAEENGPVAPLLMNSTTKDLFDRYLDRMAEQPENARCDASVQECLTRLADYCESAGWSDLAARCRTADGRTVEYAGE